MEMSIGRYLKVLPFLVGKRLDGRFELCEPQEVQVAILLLVMLLIAFGQFKGIEGVVVGGLTIKGRICGISTIW